MTAVGWLPADAGELFGPGATAEESYDVLTVDVPPADWISALRTARDRLGCTYFDWLSAVDEPGTGLRVAAHVAALSPVRRLLLRTTVAHESAVLPSAVDVYAGAAWHERETHEMFGVVFEGHPGLDHLLLPERFEGNPLRKDFVLAARVAKAWPGAKEPGESSAGGGHAGPRRRQMLPPGVPDPNEWGPLKGQLPAAPARPARDRPARRTRTAAEGSAGRAAPPAGTPSGDTPAEGRASAGGQSSAGGRASAGGQAPAERAEGQAPAEPRVPTEPQEPTEPQAPTARRARSASGGSASQRARSGGAAAPRRSRSAADGSASQRATTDDGAADEPATASAPPPTAPRNPDAPWHHARPAFDEPTTEPDSGEVPEPHEPPDPPHPREDPPGGPR